MKATELLEKQHRVVEATFDALERSGRDASALTGLANDLAAHMTVEQNIFYPAIREADPDLIAESYEEHAVAEYALKRLLNATDSEDVFRARLGVLRELILHHVEEEEQELFPRVEELMEVEELEELGARMEAAFSGARAEGFSALVPATWARTSGDESLAKNGTGLG